MKFFIKSLVTATIGHLPTVASAETLQLKPVGFELRCTAEHDCNAPLDCGGDDFKDCKPREGYCEQPIAFALQPLVATNNNNQTVFAAISIAEQEFVLAGQKKAQISVLKGETPLEGMDSWQIILSDSGQFGIQVELTNGIPSIRSYKGTCGEAN